MDWPLLGREWELDDLGSHLQEAGGSIALFGPMGVGKTRLARALLDPLAEQGKPVRWAIASPGASSIPYGAFTAWLPDTVLEATSRTAMLRSARRHVGDLARDRGVVLGIDDAHLLDTDSLVLLHQVAAQPDVGLVLTVRTGTPAPEELTTLWKDDHLLRVDLEPLTREATVRLAEAALGGRVRASLAAALWARTQGNPLFLRELLSTPGRDRWLVEEDGTWRLDGAPRVPDRLADLVAARLQELDDSARTGLLAVVLLDVPRTDVVLDLVGAPALQQLETSGMVELQHEDHPVVRLSHPVYGEVVRSSTPHSRLVAVARDLVALLEDAGDRTDAVRHARLWRLAARPGRPEIFLAAARQALARGDHEGARGFAADGLERGGGVESRLTQAEALVYLGRSDEAEALLDGVAPGEDELRARAALLRCHDQLFNHDDATAAIAAIDEVRDRVTAATWVEQLDAAAAMAALRLGDPERSVSLPEPTEGGTVDDRTLLGTLITRSLAQVLLGDLADAEPAVERAAPLVRRLRDELPLATDQLGIIHAMMAWHAGRMGDAVLRCRASLADAIEEGTVERSGVWAAMLGVMLAETGQLGAALAQLDDAASELDAADPLAMRTTALAIGARCRAGLGDLTGAAEHLEQVVDAVEVDIRTRTHHGRARAWLLAADGATKDAIDTALASGADAIAHAHVVWGAITIHDAVRFGEGPRALELLEPLAAAHDAGLLALQADHARALATDDPVALGGVAAAFLSAGMHLYAAEAHAQAADLFRRGGRSRPARRADARAASLLQSLPAVHSPALLRAADPLTRREREIAMIARSGQSSRDIADRLSLSIRTVDNHLAAIYRKTGIEGRHELDDVLAGPRPET